MMVRHGTFISLGDLTRGEEEYEAYVGERHSARTKERICSSSLSSALGISLNSLMLQISHGATVCRKLKMMSRKNGAEMIIKTTNEN